MDQILVFRRFRLNVIRFLRLSLDVNERALRDAIRTASPILLATYEGRAARAQSLMRATQGPIRGYSAGPAGRDGRAP